MKAFKLIKPTFSFLFFIFLFTSPAFSGGHVVSIEEKQLPEFLFHWLDQRELSQQWRLDTLETSGKLPLPFMRGGFMLTSQIPALGDKPGLFAWHNPVAGMGAGSGHIFFYGDMLLAIETTKSPVKILTIETGKESDSSFPDFSGIDAVFHRRLSLDGSIEWEEWVVLKPEIAKSFTVNPEVVKEIIRPIYDKMKQGYQFTPDEIHFKAANFNDDPQDAMSHLEEYFKKGPSDVPSPWLRRSDCFDLGSLMSKDL